MPRFIELQLMSVFMAAMYLIPGSACTLVWQEMVIVVGWTLLGIFLVFEGRYCTKTFLLQV